METKIFIVDDYNIFRNGLRLIIEKHTDFKVIGEASVPKELFRLLERGNPDVLVMNLAFSQKYILTIIKKLKKKYQGLPILLLTFGATEYVILECINSGVLGMLWKESTSEQLIEAISTVAAGERYLNFPESKITPKIIQHAFTKHADIHDFSVLTERETEVLILFAEGLMYKEIANRLNIGTRTVESHKNNILVKLELNSVTDMVKYAIKHRLIEI